MELLYTIEQVAMILEQLAEGSNGAGRFGQRGAEVRSATAGCAAPGGQRRGSACRSAVVVLEGCARLCGDDAARSNGKQQVVRQSNGPLEAYRKVGVLDE